MKKSLSIALICFAIFLSASGCKSQTVTAEKETISFKEIWGYLMHGEEYHVKGDEPFTDIGYFCTSISSTGRLKGAQKAPKLPSLNGSRARIHLVVPEISNSALTHFILDRNLPLRETLLNDIITFSAEFDGVQIDFESVLTEDKEAYTTFLRELRSRLDSKKTLSVALPPKRIDVENGYDYREIASIADRVIIMAYDEHWSTSKPGPVASFNWCQSVAQYSISRIDRGKVIMGLPLYGRAWQEKKLARAIKLANLNDLLKNGNGRLVEPENGHPYYLYSEEVKVEVYFDDIDSLLKKISMYKTIDVKGISFWRIGQGSRDLWLSLKPETETIPEQKVN